MKRNGLKWTREETILAFELYCRTPFGKIGLTNPDIIELAELLGRTPGSVALKMSNLAHFDPKLKERNVKGMEHGSKLDPIIFKEYYQDMEKLVYDASLIKINNYGISPANQIDILDIEIEKLPEGKDKEQIVKTRIGQYAFRVSVLNSYNKRCCITGLAMPALLVASHIKPWAVSDKSTERTNPCNGLCLNSFHDRAFDQGFITLDKNYHIIVSSQLKSAGMDEETRNWFMSYSRKQINLPDKFIPGEEFIQYHNDIIFKP